MKTSASRKGDRACLLVLTEMLQVSKTNLARDLCGDWTLIGRRGHISTNGLAHYVFVQPGSKRNWEKAKRLLALTVTQDGDDEGVLRFTDTPTSEQADLLRKFLGLRKVSPLTDEQRATLRRFSFPRDKTQLSAPPIAVPGGAAGDEPPSTHHEELHQNGAP
jgi:hypothetical protein